MSEPTTQHVQENLLASNASLIGIKVNVQRDLMVIGAQSLNGLEGAFLLLVEYILTSEVMFASAVTERSRLNQATVSCSRRLGRRNTDSATPRVQKYVAIRP